MLDSAFVSFFLIFLPEVIEALDLSHLSDVRVLHLEGLNISKTDTEEVLPEILKRYRIVFPGMHWNQVSSAGARVHSNSATAGSSRDSSKDEEPS